MSNDVRDEPGGAVPDFERDEATIGAYESAKLRYIRAITQDAEAKLREAFGKRREAINDEIANLRSLAKSRSDAAAAAARSTRSSCRTACARPASVRRRSGNG